MSSISTGMAQVALYNIYRNTGLLISAAAITQRTGQY